MRLSAWYDAVILLLLFPALFSCGDSGKGEDTSTEQFYPPDARGQYQVGVTTLYLVDQSRYERWGNRFRTLPMEVWYPSNSGTGRTNHVSDMVGELPDTVWPLLETLYGDHLMEFWNTPTSALRDAEILTPRVPFPVIFFSHGFNGQRFQNYTLCEHLASHGFVVVAPDHYGNSIFVNVPNEELILSDPLSAISTYTDRIEDVKFVYNELQKMNEDTQSPWYSMLDLERFAVSGHSYGGLTSILCGVQFDFVKAIAPMNPAWLGLRPQKVSKPLYMLQGDHDSFVRTMNGATRRIWDEALSTQKIFITLINGEHYSATDACVLIPPTLTALTEGCEPPNIDFHLANEISNAYMTAFFKCGLLGDTRYEGYLEENHFQGYIELITPGI